MGVIEWPSVSCLERGWAMGEQELNKIISIKKNTKKIKIKNLLNGPNGAEHVVWAVFVLRSTDVWRVGRG